MVLHAQAKEDGATVIEDWQQIKVAGCLRAQKAALYVGVDLLREVLSGDGAALGGLEVVTQKLSVAL